MNSNVVSQGIVLLSILSGFAFVIATEVVLRDPLPEELQRVAYSFFTTGLCSVMTVGIGVLYFVEGIGPGWTQGLGLAFTFLLPCSVGLFVMALMRLFRVRLTGEIRREMFRMLRLLAAIAIQVALLTLMFIKMR